MTTQNPFFGSGGLFDNINDVFESDPLGQRALFQGRLNELGLTGNQRNALSGQFNSTFDRFLGELGQRVRSGGVPDPSQTFGNFLNNFNPQRELLRTPGTGQGGFGPTLFDFGR